ncbi:kinase-like domain-containing protein [Glomus cerebriforme]|uniref:Kinase-like domain-containing protein n=1 Tax=Glomus cerebriforme TaxID=658196 RepID=A0A397TH54_9GLOM|nr:kinase-like domain-containing protein [Glomus cerebriforme]
MSGILNKLKIFYEFSLKTKEWDKLYVSKYYGITQDPTTQEILIIMPYYNSEGLNNIHNVDIIHRDFHSGNIFFRRKYADTVIGDLGISKSATETTDDMRIMFMTGRRPFWDRNHDTELIIEICVGLRPPIVTNAPEGYIDLMKECWHSDLDKRPTATVIYVKTRNMSEDPKNFIKIIPSPDIGPITTNNPGAIYKSRPLSDKRKFVDNQIENSFNEVSGTKLGHIPDLIWNIPSWTWDMITISDMRFITKELEFNIDMNLEQYNDENLEYFTQEFNFDI